MDSLPPSGRPGLSLTLRLTSALLAASFFVALLVGFLGPEREAQERDLARAEADREFTQAVAERCAPLLERNDMLRLSVLATTARDQADVRLLFLDRKGRVVIDTALVLGERRLGLLAHGGAFQRTALRDGQPRRESLAPVRYGGEVIGELRLQRDATPSPAAFDFGLFGIVFLCCLSLVAVATTMAQHWSARVRKATDSLLHLAAGEAAATRDEPASGELTGLWQALREMERGVQDGVHRVAEGYVALALQVVDGLERRQLVVRGHGERTARHAETLARRLELLDADQHDLELAARLQDLGKAWVRPALLKQQPPLAERDQRSIEQHPVRAAEHLDSMPSLRRVAQIVLHQNERYGGGGAPSGMRGDRIPLGSRVLAIASAFDLLTTCGERPLTWSAALEELEKGRGTVFDPWLLDLFAEELRKAPPDLGTDRAVMILPTGSAPYRVPATGEEEQDEVFATEDGELELMVDDLPPEERA